GGGIPLVALHCHAEAVVGLEGGLDTQLAVVGFDVGDQVGTVVHGQATSSQRQDLGVVGRGRGAFAQCRRVGDYHAATQDVHHANVGGLEQRAGVGQVGVDQVVEGRAVHHVGDQKLAVVTEQGVGAVDVAVRQHRRLRVVGGVRGAG